MSALRLRAGWRLLTIIYICTSTTLCSKVIWKNTGESITIQCRYESKEAISVFLKKGLEKSQDVFFTSKKLLKETHADPTRSQMHHRGYPNFDIILRKLTVNDTGVYWCMYQEFNAEAGDTKINTGEGSVLLVVMDPVIVEVDKSTAAGQSCNQSNQNLVMTSVIISAVVLFAVFIVLLLFVIRKRKYLRVENKPSPAPHNDVYEDMRGTIRR